MQPTYHVLPEKFLSKLSEIVPDKEKRESVLKSFCQRRQSTFRANTLKISAEELEQKLSNLGIETERISWYQDAFILKNVPQKILTETELYKQGFLYVQSLSSMIPPLVMDIKPDERILDIAAAPGSKTTQIAALMNNSGEILANDRSHTRIYKLQANLKLQGVTNTHVVRLPGEIIWKKLPEFFDRALVDVPCSMEGRFFIGDEKSYRDWSPHKVRDLSEKQKFLLRSAISATKTDGIIVYSTCTLSIEENEEVINWILKKEKDSIELVDINLPQLPTVPGFTDWKGKVFDKNINKTIRILPSENFEGFFVAKIKKLQPTVTLPE